MSRFANSPIRIKLYLLIICTCSFALVLAGIGFLSDEGLRYRNTVTREVSALAGIIATSSTAALSFADYRAEEETLGALRGDPRQMQAAVYNQANQLFAHYENPGTRTTPPPERPRRDGSYFENRTLVLFQSIRLQDVRIGTIMLKYSMADDYARLWTSAEIICVVLVSSLVVALILAAKLQRTITRPLEELSKTASQVSAAKDYSGRAPKFGNDETGKVIDSFNDMLSQIESRERERQESDIALRDSEERFALAAQGSNDGLWDWKVRSGKIFYSSRWKQMLGYRADEFGQDPEEWFSRIHPGDRKRVRTEIETRKGDAPEIFSCEYRIRQKNGLYIWVLCRGIAVRDGEGRVVRMAGSQTDITQGKAVDPLTGLRSRLYFIDKLESCFAHTNDSCVQCAVLFMDLDRFKVINDSLGHEAGDQLLVEVSARLQSSIRSADLLTRNTIPAVFARFGGDEFAILLYGIRKPEDAALVAERILKQLELPFYLGTHAVFATVSIGIALGESGNAPEDLLRNADAAMYYAKIRGKGRFKIFNQSIRDRAVERMELEADIRKGVQEKQFVVYYQPQVSLLTGANVGFEALLRWQHPQRGLLPPLEFIATAEETGLVIPLGLWVLKQACGQMAAWHRALKGGILPSVSVNVSFKQLSDPDFVDKVAATLAETGLNPPCLRLELTESSIMEDAELTLIVMQRLKDLNVGLELDDFGTGYSSLSYLDQLPFDAVKIDRSFVSGMPGRSGSVQLVATILGMARSLNLDVVAEGVETKEQEDRLVAMGCPLAQGFYYSVPLDAAATESLLFHGSVSPPRSGEPEEESAIEVSR
jgi:diguanylate cyclase (GGDEF)-like protein/PAS domain S-box-containing protein